MRKISAFDKLEYELYAPLSLYNTFPNFINDIVKGESPDWQDKVNSVGIEVARAENQHIGYTKNIVNKYLGKPKDVMSANIKHNFKGELTFDKDTEKLFCVSDSKDLVDGNIHIKLAIAKAQDKLNLLNKPHFCCFEKNCLYMFMTMSLIDNDINEFFEEYLYLAQKYTHSFSDVFLMAFDCIYWIDAISKLITKHELSDSEISGLDAQVHILRDVSDWKTGTPFVGTYKLIL